MDPNHKGALHNLKNPLLKSEILNNTNNDVENFIKKKKKKNR